MAACCPPAAACRPPTFLLLLLLLLGVSFLPSAEAAAQEEEHPQPGQHEDEPRLNRVRPKIRPKISAMGFVYCDQCNLGLHHKMTVPLPDVEVQVQCRDLYGFVTFSTMTYTNKDGAFSVSINGIPSIFGIEGCKASFVRSMNEHCDIVSNEGKEHIDAPFFLNFKAPSHVIFTTGPFVFRPVSLSTNCHEVSQHLHPTLHRLHHGYYPSSPPTRSTYNEKYSYISSPSPSRPPLLASPQPTLFSPSPPPPYWFKSPPPSPYYWYKSPPPPSNQIYSPPPYTQAWSPPLLSPPHHPFVSFHHHHSPPPPPPYYHASLPPPNHFHPHHPYHNQIPPTTSPSPALVSPPHHPYFSFHHHHQNHSPPPPPPY